MSLGEYAYLKLIGTLAAGTSTAAWTGMLNRREGTWDAELCAQWSGWTPTSSHRSRTPASH